jgi:ribose 1,5-bisphosphokinase
MSWLKQSWSLRNPGAGRVGPGRLVAVVGPSGAGKDTLLAYAQKGCADDPDIVFPRRAITRPSSAAEVHDTLSEAAFEHAVGERAFALWWGAHGLRYGIPIAIDDDIRAGRTVVCNVSRTVTGSIRERYARAAIVLVTAPPDVLAARLAGRDRASDGALGDRVRRATLATEGELEPDVVIENIRDPVIGGKRLLDAIYDRQVVIAP